MATRVLYLPWTSHYRIEDGLTIVSNRLGDPVATFTNPKIAEKILHIVDVFCETEEKITVLEEDIEELKEKLKASTLTVTHKI